MALSNPKMVGISHVAPQRDLPPHTTPHDLLQSSGGKWGYKAMDESMAPYYYSCPLRYLDMAKELSPGWREKVRAHHARQRQPAASTAVAVAR